MVWNKMIFLFQGCILTFHVNLPGCSECNVNASLIIIVTNPPITHKHGHDRWPLFWLEFRRGWPSKIEVKWVLGILYLCMTFMGEPKTGPLEFSDELSIWPLTKAAKKCTPCIHFTTKTGCKHGESCRFCHLEHTEDWRLPDIIGPHILKRTFRYTPVN